MKTHSFWNIAYALVVAFAVPLVVYAAASIPADCATPGDCNALTPRFESLTVTHNMSGQHLHVSGTGATPILVTNANGNVGIGTTTPAAKLSIQDTSGRTLISNGSFETHMEAGSTSDPDFDIYSHGDQWWMAPWLHLYSAGGTQAAPTARTNGQLIGTLDMRAHDGSAYDAGASIGAVTTQTWAPGAHGAALVFSTTANNSVSFGLPAERMRIDHSGNVGIGTTAPQSALHIPDGKYLQAEDNNAGAPTAADCDSDAERGRQSIDTSNNRLYVCNGAVRGWDYVDLTN